MAMMGIHIMQKMIIHQPSAIAQSGYSMSPYVGVENVAKDQAKITCFKRLQRKKSEIQRENNLELGDF